MRINNNTNHGGVGFFGLLTIALTVLKLMGYINVSWWLIAGVLFTPAFIFIAIFLVALILAFFSK